MQSETLEIPGLENAIRSHLASSERGLDWAAMANRLPPDDGESHVWLVGPYQVEAKHLPHKIAPSRLIKIVVLPRNQWGETEVI